jgi:phosphotransacetylase
MPEDFQRPGPAQHDKYERLVEAARKLPRVVTAVAHPCDEVSLESAVEAARLGIITPILCGPQAKIHAAAAKARLEIAPFELVDTEHSHAAAAAAVELVRAGRAEALM